MNMNENAKALILQGLRKKGQTKIWLADQMGLHKSWATRLLNGQIKTLDDDQVERLMSLLDIQFFHLKRLDESQISAKAMHIAAEFDRNPAFASVAVALQLSLKNAVFTPRYIPTDQMSHIGDKIINIVDSNREKPGKIARRVLELLA
jgi:hypothetical protein